MTEPARRGPLDPGALLELLSLIAENRRSGLLTLRTVTDDVGIHFEHGAVRSVITNDDELRIGQVLIQLGHVTEEQIEQALALQTISTDADQIGEVLVDVGYITESEINQAIAIQIQSSLANLMRDKNGIFEFEPREPMGGSSFPSSISFEPLVLNATYLADRWLAENQPDDVDTLPDTLIDQGVLERLSGSQRLIFQKLLETYSHLHQLAWKYGQAAQQIKESVERLLNHVLLGTLEPIDDSSDEETRTPGKLVEHVVYFVDQPTDLWSLSDMTRTARHLIMLLLNGEWRLSNLEAVLRDETDNPERAVQELVSAGLVRIDLVVLNAPAGGERPTSRYRTESLLDRRTV